MDRRLGFTLALAALIGCGGRSQAPASPVEPPAVVEPAPLEAPPAESAPPAPTQTYADDPMPGRAAVAEGPSATVELGGGPCRDYIEVTMRCMEQMASAGQFPIDRLDEIRAALEQTLQARADASAEQRDAIDQACLAALENQPPQWSQSGCSP